MQNTYLNGTLIFYNLDTIGYSQIGQLVNNTLNLTEIHKDNNKTTYTINDSIFVNSFNKITNTIEKSKVKEITVRNSLQSLHSVVHNDINQLVSNVLTYDLKEKNFDFSNPEELDKKYVVQWPLLPDTFDEISNINGMFLHGNIGYLIGYWLLRGGFYRLPHQSTEAPSWSGRIEDIDQLKNVLTNNQTSISSKVKENSIIMSILDSDLENFIRKYFYTGKYKKLPAWIFHSPTDFIENLFFGLVASNSYISQDKNNNYYLALKIPIGLTNLIGQLIQSRLGIYSKIIGENKNFLSYKFTHKLQALLLRGISEKKLYFKEFDIDSINIPKHKEIIVQKMFRAVPWYKFKINQYPINTNKDISYSFKLENNDNMMLSNGLFVSTEI